MRSKSVPGGGRGEAGAAQAGASPPPTTGHPASSCGTAASRPRPDSPPPGRRVSGTCRPQASTARGPDSAGANAGLQVLLRLSGRACTERLFALPSEFAGTCQRRPPGLGLAARAGDCYNSVFRTGGAVGVLQGRRGELWWRSASFQEGENIPLRSGDGCGVCDRHLPHS